MAGDDADSFEYWVEQVKAVDFESKTGKGVKGSVDGKQIAFGNIRLFEKLNIYVQVLASKAKAMRKDDQTVIFTGIDEKLAGFIGIADPIKKTTTGQSNWLI